MPNDDTRMTLAAQIVSAHVSHNSVPAHELPALIRQVYQALENPGQAKPEAFTPAVPVKQSIRADAVLCLDCGKTFSMLKRHIMTDHKLTPQEYRQKWSLPRDYPMVAPNYAKVRSTLAKKIGLGRSRSATTVRPPSKSAKKAARR